LIYIFSEAIAKGNLKTIRKLKDK